MIIIVINIISSLHVFSNSFVIWNTESSWCNEVISIDGFRWHFYFPQGKLNCPVRGQTPGFVEALQTFN